MEMFVMKPNPTWQSEWKTFHLSDSIEMHIRRRKKKRTFTSDLCHCFVPMFWWCVNCVHYYRNNLATKFGCIPICVGTDSNVCHLLQLTWCVTLYPCDHNDRVMLLLLLLEAEQSPIVLHRSLILTEIVIWMSWRCRFFRQCHLCSIQMGGGTKWDWRDTEVTATSEDDWSYIFFFFSVFCGFFWTEQIRFEWVVEVWIYSSVIVDFHWRTAKCIHIFTRIGLTWRNYQLRNKNK